MPPLWYAPEVSHDRATLPWHAGQVVRAGESHGGLILFRRSVRSTDYGDQARLVTDSWLREGRAYAEECQRGGIPRRVAVARYRIPPEPTDSMCFVCTTPRQRLFTVISDEF